MDEGLDEAAKFVDQGAPGRGGVDTNVVGSNDVFKKDKAEKHQRVRLRRTTVVVAPVVYFDKSRGKRKENDRKPEKINSKVTFVFLLQKNLFLTRQACPSLSQSPAYGLPT